MLEGAALWCAVPMLSHVLLLASGGSFAEAILSSPVTAAVNRIGYLGHVRRKLNEGCVPAGSVVRYGVHREQEMQIMYPEQHVPGSRAPAALCFHGGGFVIGGRELGRGVAAWATRNGMVGISVGYALSHARRWKGARTAVSDALLAVEHIHLHAEELDIDVAQLVLIGESAGGAIVIMAAKELAEQSKPVAAVVCSWPMVSFNAQTYVPMKSWGHWRPTSSASLVKSPCAFVPHAARDPQQTLRRTLTDLGIFGRRWGGWLSARPLYSPLSIFVVDETASSTARTPTILLCAEEDRITPCAQQLMFSERLHTEAVVFEGVGHGEGALNSKAGRRHILQFLNHHIALRPEADESVSDAYMASHVAALGLHPVEFTPRPWRPWERVARYRRMKH